VATLKKSSSSFGTDMKISIVWPSIIKMNFSGFLLWNSLSINSPSFYVFMSLIKNSC
jgi:hypothetical protein